MASDIAFPVFVLAKDCGEVTVFSEFEKMVWHFEPIDVENNEYQAWDAAGNLLELRVGEPKAEWLKITRSGRISPQTEFLEIKAKAVPYRDPEPLLRSLGRLFKVVRD